VAEAKALVIRRFTIIEAIRPLIMSEQDIYASGSRSWVKLVVREAWDFRLLMAIYDTDVVCVDAQ
jgi:hypothetical protein